MRHLKTYELFSFRKEKVDKPSIGRDDIYLLVCDCLHSLRDNGLRVAFFDRDGDHFIDIQCPGYSTHNRKRIDMEEFNFKDIKHEVLQFCNMVGEYNVDVSFRMEFAYQWQVEVSDHNPTYKKIISGAYDKVQIFSFGLTIK